MALNKLRPQQQRFLDTYLETGNAATAYRKAGYVTTRDGVELDWLKSNATQVLRTASMQSAITLATQATVVEREDKKEITLDWIRDQHIKLMDESLVVGDRQTATRNLEDLGKMHGAYTENLNVTTEQVRDYTEQERIDMKRITSLLLERKSLPILDVDADEVEPTSEEVE